jgi:hypothetical protein
MPPSLTNDAATDKLAKKIGKLPWLPTNELVNSLPPKFKRVLYLEGNLNPTVHCNYDKVIADQRSKRTIGSRAENAEKPFFPHRLSLALGYDEGLAVDGRAIALIVKCERLTDFKVLSTFPNDMYQRSEFVTAINDLRASW